MENRLSALPSTPALHHSSTPDRKGATSPFKPSLMIMWLIFKKGSLLHGFRYRYRAIPQHIHIASHFIIIPAVDNRLGNRYPDNRLMGIGDSALFQSRHFLQINRGLCRPGVGFMAFNCGGNPRNADNIAGNILFVRKIKVSMGAFCSRLFKYFIDVIAGYKWATRFFLKVNHQDDQRSGLNRNSDGFSDEGNFLHF